MGQNTHFQRPVLAAVDLYFTFLPPKDIDIFTYFFLVFVFFEIYIFILFIWFLT